MTGDDRKAYSPELLDEAIEQVTAAADLAALPIALCGGLAMQSYGSDRLTKDVDVVVGDHGQMPQLTPLRPLSFGGYETRAPNGVPVDVIVRSDDLLALYNTALSTAVSRPGIACLVVRPEYLAAMKLAAGRARDRLDLHYLITAPGVLDRALTREIVKRYVGGWYAARDFDTHVEDAELAALRERRARNP